MYKILTVIFITFLVSACGGRNTKGSSDTALPPPDIKKETPKTKKQPKPSSGGYYLDDGPEVNPPKNLDWIPDATPRHEAINTASTRPYQALGKTYTPMKTRQAFRQKGKASWYGKRFHGRKTANGERYDMYAMTAAHKTLPLPSYVRVTNPANRKSVVVRVNDRGPFKANRIVDLSYAAAHRLDIIQQGSAPVILEVVKPDTTPRVKPAKSRVTTAVQKTTPKRITTTRPRQATVKQQPIDGYYVQLGAFRSLENVSKLKQKVVDTAITTKEMVYHVYNGDLYKLRLGPYVNKHEAQSAAAIVRQKLQLSPIVNRNK